ncbi:zinc-ribbon domain-containing protein [Clostridium sp. SM-530-WT-3G]|uniref:zinc-ribbon domain-containing protein n=1 Tax=Clostridium sp. SM-530-WT-3G TaxID=2725303 RepID=UPI00145F16CE|nr:zinc-ribbon domain-containing protein [Clostridium sp. SM-530-WT-3G]NME81859.1 zinc-ribbon domain-containing protein [Clostridium sp. SM-530-WT-3G]
MKKYKKSVLEEYPELVKEWDYERNNGLTPADVTPGMHIKIAWICSKNPDHKWFANLSNRARKNNSRGCPYCSNEILSAENCLANVNPKLAREFSIDFNDGLTAADVQAGSGKEVYWKCSICNYIYKASVTERNKGHKKCPRCSSIAYNYPELMKDWDKEKNSGIDPYILNKGSHKIVYWKCHKCGYEWQSMAYERTIGHKECIGCKSLANTFPIIAQDWDYELNGNLTPMDVTPYSNKKVYWRCSKNPTHKERKSVNDRCNYGCSLCSRGRNTSISEVMIYLAFKEVFGDVHNRFKIQNDKKLECDILIPQIALAIEYDGYRYHKNKKEQDEEKNRRLAHQKINNKEITFIRIREEGLPKLKSYGSFHITIKRHLTKLNEFYKNLINLIELIYHGNNEMKSRTELLRKVEIDNMRYKALIYLSNIDEKSSLQSVNPELAKEWHPTKNDGLLPIHVKPFSNEVVWWCCNKCGYEWRESVSKRNAGSGCPRENGRGSAFVVTEENSLYTNYPALAEEWNVKANNGKTPSEVYYKSTLEYYWTCRRNPDYLCKMSVRKKARKLNRCLNCDQYSHF